MNEQLWRPVDGLADFQQDERGWLASRMSKGTPWLLVHADDGVIWGRREENGRLVLSNDVSDLKTRYPAIAVKLRTETLQQARVFGPAGELLIWREGACLRGRIIMDGERETEDTWREQHILWGAPVVRGGGFTLLQEGQQGPQHAIPLAVPDQRHAALTVRHYIARDSQGQAAVTLSRLLDLGLYEASKER